MKFKVFAVIAIFFIVLFLTFLYYLSLSSEKDISHDSNIWHGKGWNNNRSMYDGSEMGFTFNNSKTVSFEFSTPSKADQEIELIVDDETYRINTPHIDKQKLTIKVDKNSHHTALIRHVCTLFFEPCDMRLSSIYVDRMSTVRPYSPHKKVISVLGDSISTMYGRSNYTHMLAASLGYELHNASKLGSTVTEIKGSDNAISRYKKDLKSYNSEITLIFLGTNDAASNVSLEIFRSTYSKIIKDILIWNPKTNVVLVGILPRTDIEPAKITSYNEVIKDIAESTNSKFVDTSALLSDNDFSDAIHPSIAAHQKLFEKIKEEIKR